MLNRKLERIRADIERLRVHLAQRRRCPVIEYHDRAEVPALIEAAQREGRIAPHAGVLVVPEVAPSIEVWEARQTNREKGL
jgi:hypothetical protein